MEAYLNCIPCLVRQTLDAVGDLELDDATARALLRRTLGLLLQLDWDLPPPVIAREIHRAIRELAGSPDPYLQRKISDTEVALRLLPKVKAAVAASEHPFLTAVIFSIAGNAIDLAAKAASDLDVDEVFRGASAEALDEIAVKRLERAVRDATDVLDTKL